MNQTETIGPVNVGNPCEFTIKELAELAIKVRLPRLAPRAARAHLPTLAPLVAPHRWDPIRAPRARHQGEAERPCPTST
eukprot:4017125-Prymnesium_polylepis.1